MTYQTMRVHYNAGRHTPANDWTYRISAKQDVNEIVCTYCLARLGDYKGTRYEDNNLIDRFDHGEVIVENYASLQ